jgi:nucleoside-diphosphate-sugar epimerase
MEANPVSPKVAPPSPVLVTGANGFIGSALCRALREAGCDVRGLILQGTDAGVLGRMGVLYAQADICRPETLGEPLAGIRTVFHLAALARDWGPKRTFMRVNADGTRNVLEAAAGAGVRRFVHMSSLAVHRFSGHVDADESTPAQNRINGYCAAKIVAEGHVREYQSQGCLETTIIRPGAFIHGPGDTTVFVHLVPYLEGGKMMLLNRGRQLTCYSYVENLVEGMVLAASRPEAVGETFILTDDIKITIRELMEAMCAALEISPEFGSAPVWLARPVGWILEMLWKLARRPEPPPVHRYRANFAAKDFHFSCAKAKKVLGYRPSVPLQEGLRRTVEWYRMRNNPQEEPL